MGDSVALGIDSSPLYGHVLLLLTHNATTLHLSLLSPFLPTSPEAKQRTFLNRPTPKATSASSISDLIPPKLKMALEWVVLGYAAGAEAIMVLLLTLPGLDGLRKGLIAVTRGLLKPFLSVVPFCLFLLMDIYWKYETRPSCEGDSCTPSEHLRHQKSIMKSQRNALLIAAALLFYWLLYSVTGLVVKVEQLNQRLERLKNRD
ncbi:hypothetical protein ES288_D02G174800v1 [Gossypium darwinii]|uniref:Endoplasmic reticulum transmembrane protein n=1 Tax=Gossypium darwinii TaxID=34276 RepID=A0A5D2DE44_GOSDA|nr:hypothetical protein ES288_D02G174800v1 [Gossypium darwinii]